MSLRYHRMMVSGVAMEAHSYSAFRHEGLPEHRESTTLIIGEP